MEMNLPVDTNPPITAPPRALKTRGPRPFNATDQHRNHVKLLACLGITQEEIAKSLDVTVPTLRKFFYDELYLSAIDTGSNVVSSLIEMAAARHPGAVAIVWAKTRRGYRPGVAPFKFAPQPPTVTPEGPPPIWRTIRRKRAAHGDS